MGRLFSYVVKFDTGAAPNPFWDICTLTICKPVIRRTAKVGDWILGFGSTQVQQRGGGFTSYSGKLVYAMRVDRILSLKEYDDFCVKQCAEKIPIWKTDDWRKRLGDCVYHCFDSEVLQRKSVHTEQHISTDLSGRNALLSENFYYFGNKAVPVPTLLLRVIHKGRGHRALDDSNLISEFERWINTFKRNKLYGEPQYRHKYDHSYTGETSAC